MMVIEVRWTQDGINAGAYDRYTRWSSDGWSDYRIEFAEDAASGIWCVRVRSLGGEGEALEAAPSRQPSLDAYRSWLSSNVEEIAVDDRVWWRRPSVPVPCDLDMDEFQERLAERMNSGKTVSIPPVPDDDPFEAA